VRHALQGLDVPSPQIWIANTDADSRVDETWLVAHTSAAEAGADIRIGAVVPDFADLTARQIRAWRRTHRGGFARGHVHGANLGIRASTYLEATGFRPLFAHEDVDLVHRASKRGAAVWIDEHPDVITSGRSIGRAPEGYALYLTAGLFRDTPLPVREL
jgi:hypothetical protein